MDEEGRTWLKKVIEEAFEKTGATEHGDPQFFWSEGETMAAFKAEATVHPLEPVSKMNRVDAWRTADAFKLTCATEHGPRSLLIYNSHQPNSDKRPFGSTMQINFCKGILQDAMGKHSLNDEIVGFGFGGDANCPRSTWTT